MIGLRHGNYRYFNEMEMRIDIKGLLDDLKKFDKGSIVVFHACAHNPYGCALD
jgi:aspartate aminotransferase